MWKATADLGLAHVLRDDLGARRLLRRLFARRGRASGRDAMRPHASAIAALARSASKSPTTTSVTLFATYQRWKKSSSRSRVNDLTVFV